MLHVCRAFKLKLFHTHDNALQLQWKIQNWYNLSYLVQKFHTYIKVCTILIEVYLFYFMALILQASCCSPIFSSASIKLPHVTGIVRRLIHSYTTWEKIVSFVSCAHLFIMDRNVFSFSCNWIPNSYDFAEMSVPMLLTSHFWRFSICIVKKKKV